MKTIKRITSVVLSLIFCFGFALTSVADTLLSTQQSALSKIAPEIMQAFEAGEKKVPVYIWLTDINQDSVEKEVEQKTGLTKDTLSVRTETSSAELAQAITDESTRGFSEKTTTEFNSYLERTEQARELERINTDTYISERRAIARSKIEAKNTAFVTSAEISESSIIFQSAYAPMLIAELSEYQVQMLAGRMDVVEMTICEEKEILDEYDELQGWRKHTGTTKVQSSFFNLNGQGVNIGIAENGNVKTHDELPSERFYVVLKEDKDLPQYISDHAQNVARLCAGEYGIAKKATVYHVSIEQYSVKESIEMLIDRNVSVINCSFGSPALLNYSSLERYFDYLIVTHNVSIVVSAGNDFDKRISEPGLAYNVITVGGYYHYFTEETDDDRMCAYSYYEQGGCMKPDVIAIGRTPFFEYYDDENGNTSMRAVEGTSFAAPIVTGFIALMIQLKPSLASQPEVIKAIVLASCHRKVKPATEDSADAELMIWGITDKQGAGVFDPYIALSIISHGTYGRLVMEDQVTEFNISFIQPRYSSTGMNVSVAWLRQNTKTVLNTIDTAARENIDISLWAGSDLVGESTDYVSSTEMIYHLFSNTTSSCYELNIYNNDPNEYNTRIGYAWSVNTTHNQYSTNETGFYLLKNVGSGHYLQTNNTEVVNQGLLNGNSSQIWLCQQAPYVEMIWNMLNVANMDDGFLTALPSADNDYLVSTNDAGVLMMRLLPNGKSFCFLGEINDSLYKLGVVDDELGASAVWEPFDENVNNITDYQKWYMEKCAYQLGDVDMNGVISATDARGILRVTVALDSFTYIQSYLGDVNGDGLVNSADARLTLRYATGKYVEETN